LTNPEWTEDEKLLLDLARKTTPFDLPIGVYVVSKDGRFLDCNKFLRNILHLPLEGTFDDNIKRFYADPQDRDQLTKLVDSAIPQGDFCENKKIRFDVNGSEVWAKVTCRAVFQPDSDIILGYFGYLVDITEEVKLSNLFDQLPAGVYRLDKDDIIVLANQAVVRLLGYDNQNELVGHPVNILYPSKSEAQAFRDKVIAEGKLIRDHLVLVKKTGKKIHVLVTASALYGDSNEYVGREGIIVDENAEALYRQFFNEVPIGTYEIEMAGSGEKVINCNTDFAHIFGFDTPEEVIGKDIWKEVFQDPEGYKEYINEIKEAHNKKVPLLRHDLRVRKKNHEPITVEVHARLLDDRVRNITIRVGALRDVSGEVALHELRDNIGRTLHYYSSGLVLIQQSLIPVRTMIERTHSNTEIATSSNDFIEFLDKKVTDLLKKLHVLFANEFISKIVQITGREKYDISRTELLNLDDYKERIPFRELHISAIRDSVANLNGFLEFIAISKESPAIAKAALLEANKIEQLCCFASLVDVQERVFEMEYQVRSLQEFVTNHERIEEPKIRCNVQNLIISAIRELWAYAKIRMVEIEHTNDSKDVVVEVQLRSMTRAISNLLHNAIKYSWSKQSEKPVVKIHQYSSDGKVIIEFNNWGVPITKEEIEKELVFEIGYRGSKSGDRGRLGTGIGLHDARMVARAHKGDVTIKSIIASPEKHKPGDYESPYLTTATLTIPIHYIEGK
jgi:PAS domain S-box-containing protein